MNATAPEDKTRVRNAATIIIVRQRPDGPAVLMGQRGRNVAFMPGKFVFPGGAVDLNDATIPLTLAPDCAAQLTQEADVPAKAIAAAAIRELWEETGQILGHAGDWSDAPQGWRGFARSGHLPNGEALRFFFRAITPEGQPRRFDARFFVADAEALVSDPDDFSGAEDELSHLQWVPLAKARTYELAFITQVVLAELMAELNGASPRTSVPFFRNNDEDRLVAQLDGRSLL